MRKNHSYTYLLPLLSEQVNLKQELLKFMINTYIKTNKNNFLGNFYILCRFNYDDKAFTELESLLTNNELYIKSYSINDYVLYQYEFPKEYEHEQIKFKDGKYSEFKDDAKQLILSFWGDLYGHIPSFVTNTLLKIKQIFNKDDKLRIKMCKELGVSIEKGSELGNLIDDEKETYFFQDEEEKVNLNNIKDIF